MSNTSTSIPTANDPIRRAALQARDTVTALDALGITQPDDVAAIIGYTKAGERLRRDLHVELDKTQSEVTHAAVTADRKALDKALTRHASITATIAALEEPHVASRRAGQQIQAVRSWAATVAGDVIDKFNDAGALFLETYREAFSAAPITTGALLNSPAARDAWDTLKNTARTLDNATRVLNFIDGLEPGEKPERNVYVRHLNYRAEPSEGLKGLNTGGLGWIEDPALTPAREWLHAVNLTPRHGERIELRYDPTETAQDNRIFDELFQRGSAANNRFNGVACGNTAQFAELYWESIGKH